MFTHEFRRHFIKTVPWDTLMTLRLATKGWNAAADALIDEGVRSEELIASVNKPSVTAVVWLPFLCRRR
ncbi:hypothetical protein TrLO_g13712 [Triparma laevis f. longispina]|uniref:Uncharacterized protein n=1 Tax=Triparma laevis f. longispina TaxID=1714387 RepID=A0A9W7E4Q9_9STRA|nr:hypothetical protein TrLO_g13712 [Triparma laevis f. longispina]